MAGTVSFLTVDHLQMGKSSRYVADDPGQLSLAIPL